MDIHRYINHTIGASGQPGHAYTLYTNLGTAPTVTTTSQGLYDYSLTAAIGDYSVTYTYPTAVNWNFGTNAFPSTASSTSSVTVGYKFYGVHTVSIVTPSLSFKKYVTTWYDGCNTLLGTGAVTVISVNSMPSSSAYPLGIGSILAISVNLPYINSGEI